MRGTEPFSRRDVVLLILLAGLVALFFWRILTPNPADRAQFPAGDFTDQFYAFRVYEARAFSEGRIPLWSENFNSGHPFLADIQSAVFYPIALANVLGNLALFQSFSLFALELEALFHFWLAGVFTYLFARRVIKNRMGAFTSALVFMFGGYLTSYPSLQLAILETAVWLPLALFFLDRAAQEETFQRNVSTDGIAAGMVLGVAALAGHPQTFLFVVSVCVIYFVWRNWKIEKLVPNEIKDRKSKFEIRLVGQVVFMLVIAFGIAAIQLIPAIEYQQLSTREALSFADAAKGFPTLDVLQFILPGYASAFASPLYVGILPLWLALFALTGRRTTDDGGRNRISDVAFWGLLALGALILSFGFYVFAYVIFYLFVPGASLFRQQERLAFVVSFALAMLAGYGMTELLGAFDLKRARKLFFVLPAGAVLMLALVITFFVAGAQNPEGRLAFLGDRAGLMLLQFALASLLLGLYLRQVISVKWFAPLAIVLILFDVWSVNEPANKGPVVERYGENPLVEIIKQDTGIFRVANENQLPSHSGIVYGFEEIGGVSPLRLARYDAILGFPREKIWQMLNVKYVLTEEPRIFTGRILAQDGRTSLVRLEEYPQPRAWFVERIDLGPTDELALNLTKNAFTPTYAIVSTRPPIKVDPRSWSEGQVKITNREPEHMTLDVNTPADGLLIISENFYPGWRATIDGEPVEILRANLTLRAIPVRVGAHRIEMWYEPLSFQVGATISVITLVVCGGALVIFRNRASD